MELRPPRQKFRKEPISTNLALPIREANKQYIGYFNGFSVVVPDAEAAKEIVANGCFGKPQFSKTVPSGPAGETVEILRERQYLKRKTYPLRTEVRPKKIVIVADSDGADDDEYFTNLKPTYGLDRSTYENRLVLSLVEAYFLSAELNCLKIHAVDDAWKEFNDIDVNFGLNYAVYVYFRAKNWVVKSGMKFGGDFLLYKQGPAYYHASYVVIIDVIDENFKRIDNMKRRSMEYKNLIGLNRLCESTGKELLLCQVVWPENTGILSPKDIQKLSINEVLIRRFILSQG